MLIEFKSLPNTIKMKKVLNVLLIDDNEIDNLIHERLLKDLAPETEVKVFQSSTQALDYLIATATQNPQALPDLILLDLHMPMMDGFAFMKAYQKADLSLVKKTNIIGLSCSIFDQEIQDMLAYEEVSAFITKPLNRQKISQIVQDNLAISE
ncbi:MAG: response regulator [Microscillaceae bacterium]